MYGFWWITIGVLVGFCIFGIPIIVSMTGHEVKFVEKRDSDSFNGYGIFSTIMMVICGFCLILFFGISVGCRASAKEQYYNYLETSEMIERVLEEGSDFENIAITETIIDYNKGIAEAKASQKTWGRFSQWYGYNLDKLKYVRVPNKYEEDVAKNEQ